MSSISPTDSSMSNYYSKEIPRIEEQIKNEAKRTRELNEAELKRINDNYHADLRKREEESKTVAQGLRDSAEEALANEREKYKASLDRLKDQTYNNRGISGAGNPAATGELEEKYHRGFDELTQQLHDQQQKNRIFLDREADRLEQSHQRNFHRQENENSETLRASKEASNNTIKSIQETHNAEIDELRNKYYNNKGQLANTVPYETFKKTTDDLDESKRKQISDLNKSKEIELDKLRNTHRQEMNKKDEEIQQGSKRYQNSAQDAWEREKQAHLSHAGKLNDENGELRKQLGVQIPYKEHETKMNALQQALDEKQARYSDSISENQKHNEHNAEQIAKNSELKIKQMTDSHIEETHNLEQQLGALNDYSQKENKKISKKQVDLVHGFENTHRQEMDRLRESYDTIIDNLKNSNQERESIQAEKLTQALHEKDTHWANQINHEQIENAKNLKELQNEFSAQQENLEKARRKEHLQQEEALASLEVKSSEQQANALSKQAETFRNKLSEESRAASFEREALQKALQKQRDPQDVSVIPPGIDAALRKALVTEYEKSLNAEVTKNKIATEQMQQKYIDNYKLALEEFQDRETRLQQQGTLNQQTDKILYQDSLFDSSSTYETKLRNQEQEHDRERSNLLRQFSILLDRQKKEFEHIFSASSNDAAARYSNLKKESEINSKLTHRAFAREQNELIRGYEKKLADQKADYDLKLEDFKMQMQVTLRDQERRSSKELEEQAKGYEMRIAQQEAQVKERERYMAQNYQDELDRTKRSYELLLKKKS